MTRSKEDSKRSERAREGGEGARRPRAAAARAAETRAEAAMAATEEDEGITSGAGRTVAYLHIDDDTETEAWVAREVISIRSPLQAAAAQVPTAKDGG